MYIYLCISIRYSTIQCDKLCVYVLFFQSRYCRNHQCLVRTMNVTIETWYVQCMGTIETWYVQCMGTIETWWNIIHTVHWFDKNMVHTVFEHDRNVQGTKYEADIQPKLTIAFILSRCLYIVLLLCCYLGCNICMSAFFWWSIFIHPVLAFNSHSPYISFNRWLDREAWNTCIIPNEQ